MMVNTVNYKIIKHDTREGLVEILAGKIVGLIGEASGMGEQFNMALSGGSTPGILFDYLAGLYGPGSAEMPALERVNVYWVDERCVPADHPDSNFRMAKERLLQKIPIPEDNIHRIRGEDKPEEEAMRYSRILGDKLPATNGLPSFDLILLGMGGDGHTASIFPDRMDLLSSERLCATAMHPETGQHRITITGRVINNAARVYFLVTGSDKSETLGRILGKDRGYEFPAAHIHPEHGILTWFLDTAAASRVQ
jgi:6-phosphogluconolactonase